MADKLWQFAKNKDTQRTVPILVPVGTETSVGTTPNFTAAVDVVNDFYWTHSKKRDKSGAGRDEVPSIYLKERRVKTNSYIAQMIYSGGAGLEGIKDLIKNVKSGVDFGVKTGETIGRTVGLGATQGEVAALKEDVKENSLVKGFSELLGKVKLSASETGKKIGNSELVKELAQKFDEVAGDDPNFLVQDWMKSYKGLYITEPTGWNFRLPFFQNDAGALSNSWGAAGGNGAGAFFLKGVTDLAEGFGALGGAVSTFFDTGSYQEKAQFYNFAQTGDAVNVAFPLINTGSATYEDVIRNWQLIFLILYNNRHERINKNLVDIPPLYECRIPGMRYMPLSFLSSIGVQMRGSRRLMKLEIPGDSIGGNAGKDFVFTAVIPEAYQVNLTITNLVADSKNFMYSSVVDSDIIRVYDRSEVPDRPARGTGGLNLPRLKPF